MSHAIKDDIIVELLRTGRLSTDAEGNVVSNSRRGSNVIGTPNAKGYVVIGIRLCGRIVYLYAHRIVCIDHHGLPPSPDYEVNHKDLNKSNNRPINLEWQTSLGNIDHFLTTAIDNGKRRGVEHHGAKLTELDVLAMRGLASAGLSFREIARRYGVNRQTATSAIRGTTWKHVTSEPYV